MSRACVRMLARLGGEGVGVGRCEKALVLWWSGVIFEVELGMGGGESEGAGAGCGGWVRRCGAPWGVVGGGEGRRGRGGLFADFGG